MRVGIKEWPSLLEGFQLICSWKGSMSCEKGTPVPREHPGRMTQSMKNLKISSKSKSPNFLSPFSFLSSSSCSSPFSSPLPLATLLLAQLKLLLLHYLRLLQLPLLFFFFCNYCSKPTTMPRGITNNHSALPTNSSTPNLSATIQVPRNAVAANDDAGADQPNFRPYSPKTRSRPCRGRTGRKSEAGGCRGGGKAPTGANGKRIGGPGSCCRHRRHSTRGSPPEEVVDRGGRYNW